MEAPPPYMPVKKRNTGLIVGLVIGGVLLCCILPIGLLIGGGLFVFKAATPIVTCSIAYTDARDAIRQYAKEHGGKLPEADHWQDEVKPYYDKIVENQPKDRNPFGTMPSTGSWGCDNGSGGHTGMAFNDDIAGKPLDKVVSDEDIVLFEIEQATANAHEKFTKRSDASAPKIFGAPRGWFLIRMSGEPALLSKGMESPVGTGPRVRN